MKRIVSFKSADPKNQQRFELLYTAILVGGITPARGQGGIEVLRKEGRLLDALDAISDPVEESHARRLPNGDPARCLRGDVTQLVLSQADHELLKKRLEEALWQPRIARDVVDCVDWFTTAAEQQDA